MVRRTMKIHRARCFETSSAAESVAAFLNGLESRFLFVASAISGSDWQRSCSVRLHRVRFEERGD
jgi:hypothetical protein